MTSPELVVLVRFKSALGMDEVRKVIDARSGEFKALAGLTQKYYLQDAATGEYGGLYLWKSQGDFLEYRDSDLRASIGAAYQTQGDPRIEVLNVIKTLRE